MGPLIRRSVLATSLGLGLAVTAATTPASGAGALTAPSPPTGISGITQIHWAGYAATGGDYRSVRARWVQPTSRCASPYSAVLFWVGFDGIDSSTVEQAGTGVSCDGGKPRYFAWHELYPEQSVVEYSGAPVRPGDVVSATVTWTGGDHYVLGVTNRTRGWTRTSSGYQDAARSSVEVVAEAPIDELGVLPLTDFGSVRFRGSTVNGAGLGSVSPFRIHMATHSGVLLAETGPLDWSTAFTVTWKHT